MLLFNARNSYMYSGNRSEPGGDQEALAASPGLTRSRSSLEGLK